MASFCWRKRLGVTHQRQTHPVQRVGKAAVRQHKIREFYFSSGNYSGAEMAETLIDALRDMARIFRKQKPPFIASISKSGKAEIRLK